MMAADRLRDRIGRLRYSLRAQLLAWILLTLAGTLCLNASFSYIQSRDTARLITDNMLRGSARMIAEAIHVDTQGNAMVEIPPAALEIFDTGYADRVYYKVTGAWGGLMAGYADLPATPETAQGTIVTFRDEVLRTLTLNHPVVDLGQGEGVTVTVAVTRYGMRAMQWRLMLSDLRNQILLVLVAAGVTLIGLRRGLAPLLRLREAVSRNRDDRLDPFDPALVQTEIRPLVEALNSYMGRVQGQMAAQRRFVSNAAHQLRTPLALMATQTGFALREEDPAKRTEALQALVRSTRQTSRLAEQLLTLARAEPGGRRPRHEPVDMGAVLREVLEARVGDALAKGIDLGLETDGAPDTAPDTMPETMTKTMTVSGDGTMLREMVVNLIDNALRYTPGRQGAEVTARLRRAADRVILEVADTGPGIPEAERTQVFERFYRIMGTEAEGSGLGLAIVREVVTGSGGTVSLGTAPGGGLLVTVVLPAA